MAERHVNTFQCQPLNFQTNRSPMKWGEGGGGEERTATKHARANRNCKHKYLCTLTETDGNHLIRPNISALT